MTKFWQEKQKNLLHDKFFTDRAKKLANDQIFAGTAKFWSYDKYLADKGKVKEPHGQGLRPYPCNFLFFSFFRKNFARWQDFCIFVQNGPFDKHFCFSWAKFIIIFGKKSRKICCMTNFYQQKQKYLSHGQFFLQKFQHMMYISQKKRNSKKFLWQGINLTHCHSFLLRK